MCAQQCNNQCARVCPQPPIMFAPPPRFIGGCQPCNNQCMNRCQMFSPVAQCAPMCMNQCGCFSPVAQCA
ncbi:hypothetical protein PMAYCL1PPCAC_20914, partial [Pristionchus mayeri]